MPVRSSDGSVFRWPDAATVHRAAREWAARLAAARPDVLRVGYFGSYARGDWGVGSDLDLVAVVAEPLPPGATAGRDWDTTALPVPADLLVYAEAEFRALVASDRRMGQVLREEVVWVGEGDGASLRR
jgi:uncharacterized protein